MKKYFVISIIFLLLTGCSSQAQDHSEHNNIPNPRAESKKILYYVDPMHPQYTSDKPGKAPDCGMDLVPVYEEAAKAESAPASMKSMLHLSPEKQQLIGIKTTEVESKNLTRDIEISARVANDPDLFLAQQEYLISLRTSGGANSEINSLQSGLVQSARNRLQILGMSPAQIDSLKRSRTAQGTLLLPNKGASTWLFGEVYESDLPFIKAGQSVSIGIPGTSEKMESVVDSIAPNINPNTRTAQIRVSVPNPAQNSQPLLRPNMFLKMTLHAELGSALSIPDTALLDTGLRKIAFVEKEAGMFEPREIKTGKRGTGYVEVLSGLSKGEKVVTQGNFLLDSESSLKALINTGAHSH